MKKLLILAACAMVLAVGCKEKGKVADAADADSTAVVGTTEVAEQDTTPLPMFLHCFDKNHMQVPYWTETTEPKKSGDNDENFDKYHAEWQIQDMLRRNAALYTKLFIDDNTTVDVKYDGTITKNPDGGEAYYGVIHSRPGIPMQGARYVLADPEATIERSGGQMFVLVTENYLKSRKQLDCKGSEGDKTFAPQVLARLEKQYDMKVSRSMISWTIGKRYDYGVVQFKPKNKSVLALEVITDGDSLYSYPVKGYYESDNDFGWNVDDEGEYYPSYIAKAFEGPNGLELCFIRGCVESTSVGLLLLRDGKFDRLQYAIYQDNIPDEMAPLWKTYAAKMRKLYLEDDPHENKYYELTRYFAADLDEDGYEEYWLRDKDDKHGALFTSKNGNIELIGVEDGQRQASIRKMKNGSGFVSISGPAGGPSYYYEIYELQGSRVVHRFNALEVYGEMDECHMDGKPMDKAKGAAYLKNLPKESDYYVYFQDIDQQ